MDLIEPLIGNVDRSLPQFALAVLLAPAIAQTAIGQSQKAEGDHLVVTGHSTLAEDWIDQRSTVLNS